MYFKSYCFFIVIYMDSSILMWRIESVGGYFWNFGMIFKYFVVIYIIWFLCMRIVWWEEIMFLVFDVLNGCCFWIFFVLNVCFGFIYYLFGYCILCLVILFNGGINCFEEFLGFKEFGKVFLCGIIYCFDKGYLFLFWLMGRYMLICGVY